MLSKYFSPLCWSDMQGCDAMLHLNIQQAGDLTFCQAEVILKDLDREKKRVKYLYYI